MTKLVRPFAVSAILTSLAAPPAMAQMTQAWAQAHEGTPCRLLLAPDGDLIVGASRVVPSTVSASAFHDSVIARYSPDGQLRWMWQSGETQNDLLHDLAVDDAGNIYAVGRIGTSFWGQAPHATRLMKFSPTGQRQWTASYTPSRAGFDTFPEGVRVSPDGSAYIFGRDNGQSTSQDVFIARYSPTGAHQWTFRRAGPVVDFVFDLAFDADSNAYWAGSTFRPGTSLTGGTLGKLNAAGQQQWIWLQPVGANAGGWLHDVSIDHAGNIVATGHNEYFPGYQDGVLLRTSPDGHVLTHVTWDGPDGRWDRFFSHAILSDDSVIASGDTYAGDGAEYYDVPTIRFSPSGEVLWSDIFGSTLFYPSDTEEWALNTLALPGDQVLTISTDWDRPGYDYALHRYSRDGALLERVVSVLPAGTADIKEIPTHGAVHDRSTNALYLLGWGAGPSSNPLADHYTLIRVNLSNPAPTCPADLDDGSGTGTPDGGITIDDLVYFLARFEDGSGDADLDDGSGTGTPDGGITIDDLVYFLTHFQGGC